jgi:hypothetical protein
VRKKSECPESGKKKLLKTFIHLNTWCNFWLAFSSSHSNYV